MFSPLDLPLLTNLALACAAIAGALLPSVERAAHPGDAERGACTAPDASDAPPPEARD